MDVKFTEELQKYGSSRTRASAMQHALRLQLAIKTREDPALYKTFSAKLEAILQELKDTCSTTLDVGQKCEVNVTFTPPKLGPLMAILGFTDNAPNSPQAVPLVGRGGVPVTLTLSGSYFFLHVVGYGMQKVGTTSAPKTFRLTNNQDVALTHILISTKGDFSVSATTCHSFLLPPTRESSLAAGASCAIEVTFAPTQTGTRTGTLIVKDDAGNSPQVVFLGGTGN